MVHNAIGTEMPGAVTVVYLTVYADNDGVECVGFLLVCEGAGGEFGPGVIVIVIDRAGGA